MSVHLGRLGHVLDLWMIRSRPVRVGNRASPLLGSARFKKYPLGLASRCAIVMLTSHHHLCIVYAGARDLLVGHALLFPSG